MPQDKILILNVIIPCNPLLDTVTILALVGEFTRRKELIILVLGHPDRLGSENGTTNAKRARAGQQHLTRGGHQLIRHRLVSDGVDAGVVANLEHTVAVDAGVRCSTLSEDSLLCRVAHLPRVVVVLGHGDAVLVEDSVLVSVDCGIHAEREHVLVEGCHDAGTDVGSPGDGGSGLLVVEGDGREDTGGPDFEFDVGGLVEDEGKDVSSKMLVSVLVWWRESTYS